MRDLGFDPETGDLAISATGDLPIVADGSAIMQALKVRLRLFVNEWFLDNRKGVDYYRHVLLRKPNARIVGSLIRAAILGTPGVTRLTRYNQDINASTRTLTVSFTVETEDQELLELNEVLL